MDCSPQPPLSMGFSRQERCSGLPFPSPEDLPNPGMEPMSLMSSSLSGRFFITSTTWKACVLSCVQLFVSPRPIAHQAPLSRRFPRQEDWSELSFSPPGDLPDPGIEPMSPVPPTLVGRFFTMKPLLML